MGLLSVSLSETSPFLGQTTCHPLSFHLFDDEKNVKNEGAYEKVFHIFRKKRIFAKYCLVCLGMGKLCNILNISNFVSMSAMGIVVVCGVE